jgi:hypothetical protein
MKKNFEEFLQEEFAKQYTGIKDQYEVAEEQWFEQLDVSELIEYGDKYADSRYNTIVRLLKEHKDNNKSTDMAYQGALVDVLEIIKGL